MTAMQAFSNTYDRFGACWNWKAALLSAFFRGIVSLVAAIPAGPAVLRGIWIVLTFRVIMGGFWGSLAQALRAARPAWLAGVCVAVLLPACVHSLEFAILRAGHATHIRTGMMISIVFTAASLLLNWALMRRGLLITGEGAQPLLTDLRRLPRELARIFVRTVEEV